MTAFDFDGACAYAIGRLERELDPDYTYHNVGHTRDDVVPAVARLAAMLGVEGEDRLLLLTAAHFHDLGFVYQYADHERISIEIARERLPMHGYTAEQIEVIAGIIQATSVPQSPTNLLEEIMADADMDSLGRDDFFEVAGRLRREMQAMGYYMPDEEWYQFEIDFLTDHSYFTSAAREIRDANKARHIRLLQDMLEPTT